MRNHNLRKLCKITRTAIMSLITGVVILPAAMVQSEITQPDWHAPSYIKKVLFAIAYKNEYEIAQSKLRRWQGPIRYQVSYWQLPSPFTMGEDLVNMHFQDLAAITQLPITAEQINPNFRVIFTKKSHYAEAIERFMGETSSYLSSQSNCVAQINVGAGHNIAAATVIIPADSALQEGQLPACVVEEITQAMGLPNDVDWAYPTIANDKSDLDLLSGLDYLLLKIIYDQRLQPGFNVAQSEQIVTQILQEFISDATIANATNKVSQLDMNQFLQY